ncbi:MAG: hypothetical protein BGN85_08820 [Alphaproteobacteria bacterium 64-11]|nr:MAG: hypothetical protein BGN85_08820 [Alphaproteobacteria bacterium 64-11]
MNRHGAIELDWADGTFAFRLSIAGIEELEEKTGKSVFDLAGRASPMVRDMRVREISETIRIGLIGGGMAPGEALAKVRRYVDERPLDESRDVAHAVLLMGLTRVHGEDLAVGEAGAPEADQNGSTSAPSMEGQP